MSKLVYLLLIVALATLITAAPADDKKGDAAKSAEDAAKDAAKKGKDGASDAADAAKKGADDAEKKAKDADPDKKKDDAKGKLGKIPKDFEDIAGATKSLGEDFFSGVFGFFR